jgi:hypothetical protein
VSKKPASAGFTPRHLSISGFISVDRIRPTGNWQSARNPRPKHLPGAGLAHAQFGKSGIAQQAFHRIAQHLAAREKAVSTTCDSFS